MPDDINAIDPSPISKPPVHVDDGSSDDEVVFSPEEIDIKEDIKDIDISKAQEDTRARIAIVFTYIFLLIVGMCLFLPFVTYVVNPKIFPNPIENSKNLLTATASILSAPFGFIVGFYFKQSTNEGNRN